jgi:putative heme-binding domain-containing protein
VRETGFQFGPELTDVGRRLSRRELIESIIEPSRKVDPKYVTTTIITSEGKTEIGFIAQKAESSLTLLTSEGKQKTIALNEIDDSFETNQSSMPENLASTLAPVEFLDVIEYLTTLKQ